MTLPSTDLHDAGRQVEVLGLEAGHWVAHLTDEDPESSTPELEHDFLNWVTRSPTHLAMFLDTYETYRRLAHIDPQRQIDIEELVQQCRAGLPSTGLRPGHADGAEKETHWKRYSRLGLAACTIGATLVGCYLLTMRGNAEATPLYYSTDAGEQRQVLLKDGSELTLNTASQVEVIFTRRKRQVHWTSGDVSVKVHQESRPFVLTAGEGPLLFDDKTLPEVIAEFNRRNTRHFVIADPSIANARLTAVFQSANPDKLLVALRTQDIVPLAPDPAAPGTIRLAGKKQPSN